MSINAISKTDSINFAEADTSLAKISQWIIDSMISKTSVCLQALSYVTEQTPDSLELLYKVKLYEQRAHSTIHNINYLYDADSSLPILSKANYDINHFLTSLSQQVLKFFDSNSITISVHCSDKITSGYFDARRTSLILYNLLSNSILHSGKAEITIDIDTFIRGDYLIFTVTDNGRKISPKKQKTIFTEYKGILTKKEIYEQASGIFTLGMGLPVSLKAANEMGGNLVYLPSKSGNTFELSISQSNIRSVGKIVDYEPDYNLMLQALAKSKLRFKYNE